MGTLRKKNQPQPQLTLQRGKLKLRSQQVAVLTRDSIFDAELFSGQQHSWLYNASSLQTVITTEGEGRHEPLRVPWAHSNISSDSIMRYSASLTMTYRRASKHHEAQSKQAGPI